MALKLANNAASTLAAAISSGSTSLTLTTGGGSEFPALGANDYTIATLVSASNPNIVEIIYVYAISGDSFTTITRGQEGTTALNWNANDLVQGRPTAGAITSRQTPTTSYAGNPNTHVAGQLYDMVWDSTHLVLWECTTTGTAGTAVWKMTSAKTLNNTLDDGSGGAIISGGGSFSGVYYGDGSTPVGITGTSGVMPVILDTPAIIVNGSSVWPYARNVWTTISIGSAYSAARIGIFQAFTLATPSVATNLLVRRTGSGVSNSVAQIIYDSTNVPTPNHMFFCGLNGYGNPQFDVYTSAPPGMDLNLFIYLIGYYL